MLNKKTIASDIDMLNNHFSTREDKYRRNFNRYTSNGARSENIWKKRVKPYVYSRKFNMFDKETKTPVFNVIRSSVNTIHSKMSQTKVRPFFNPINGLYKTQQVCRNAQTFFDEYFDKEGIYSLGNQAIKDAMIFEYGALWVDEDAMEVKLIKPWEYYYDPAELQEQKITRCYIRKKEYPIRLLKDVISNRKKEHRELFNLLKEQPLSLVNYVIYYDLEGGKKYHIINGNFVSEKSIEYTIPPVIMLWYEDPIKSGQSTSLVDNLYDIQRAIDLSSNKIYSAAELSPSNSIFVPRGSNIKASMVSNEAGNIYEYQPLPSGGNPIQVSTPGFIDPSYINLLEMTIQFAYNMEGISELSAQSKKPSGLDSGVALQTMEDIESERHNVLLQNYIRFMMGVAIRVIEIFDDNDNILPKKLGRSDIKWKQLKDEKENFSIQFSASSSLSKDPKVKMEQIEKLNSMGLIDPATISSLLEFPDLQNAYSISAAAYDQCYKIIERAVEDENYEFFEIVDLNMLYRQIINTMMRLDSADEDPKIVNRLTVLLIKVKNQIDQINNTIMEQQAPPAEEPLPEDVGMEELPPEVDEFGNPIVAEEMGAAPTDLNGMPIPEQAAVLPGGTPAGMPSGMTPEQLMGGM